MQMLVCCFEKNALGIIKKADMDNRILEVVRWVKKFQDVQNVRHRCKRLQIAHGNVQNVARSMFPQNARVFSYPQA
jgi:hypothetical protein